jgi:hypothetical protein
MPNGGGAENFVVRGADPSSGGNAVVDMGAHASEVGGDGSGRRREVGGARLTAARVRDPAAAQP